MDAMDAIPVSEHCLAGLIEWGRSIERNDWCRALAQRSVC
jgi:hypothetical protein